MEMSESMKHTHPFFFLMQLFVLTDTLKPDVVVVEAAAAVAGVARKEVRTLAVLANLRAKHLALVGI